MGGRVEAEWGLEMVDRVEVGVRWCCLANTVKYLDFENGGGGEGRLLSNSHEAMLFMVASATVVWEVVPATVRECFAHSKTSPIYHPYYFSVGFSVFFKTSVAFFMGTKM
ncbi:hypothetical protein ACJW30_11G061400 [Castanea mollissima]